MNALSSVKCFLLDMDGTFYLGDQLIEGSLRFIQVLESQGREYLFLTNNSSKSRQEYAEKITRLGLPVPAEKVFTSGEATAQFLQRSQLGKRLFVVGTESLEEEFRKQGYTLDDKDPEVAVLGFDTTLTYRKLWRLCDFVRAGLPYIATHPDFNCPTENGYMPDIGAMIAFVDASTGRKPDHVIGKPNREIIEAVSRRQGLPISQLAMVGDRLYTDIALGSTSGIATVLVLSGETRLEDLKNFPYRPNLVVKNLGELAGHLEAIHPR